MMRNTKQSYGVVSIVLHWLMAIAVISMFALGWYMVDLNYYDALYKKLPFVHKSVGLVLAAVLVFRIIWTWINPSPQLDTSVSLFERVASRWTHRGLYLLLVLIVGSGYLISTADGASISVFNWFEVPATLTFIPEQEDRAGLVHEYLAYVLMTIVLIHAGAALKHHFVDRDNTLQRMLGRL